MALDMLKTVILIGGPSKGITSATYEMIVSYDEIFFGSFRILFPYSGRGHWST